MKYTEGKIGKIYIIKFDDNDILFDKLSEFVIKENIKTAVVLFIGALRKGILVTGPKKPVIPPIPNKLIFNDGWETLGIGTIYTNKKGPQIHIHSAMGKKNRALTGCIRGETKVFLVVEAVVFELKGTKATKTVDKTTGLNLLTII